MNRVTKLKSKKNKFKMLDYNKIAGILSCILSCGVVLPVEATVYNGYMFGFSSYDSNLNQLSYGNDGVASYSSDFSISKTKVGGDSSFPRYSYVISLSKNGSIASNNTGILSGGTVYNELRPASNGTFIKTTNTTKANLTALDTAAKNAIKALSVSGKTITYTKGDGTTGTITTQDTNTTYNNMTAATDSVAGTAGLVPAPAAGKQNAFLRGDGTWVVPIDTNTHYTSHMYVGSGTAANAATTNGNTKIALVDDSTVRNTLTIKGTGSTSVTSDANGVITINSTDNNTTYGAFIGATSSAAGGAGLVKAPSAGDQAKFLRGDGTWATDNDTHWTSHMYVGSGTAANAATTNGNTKIALADNSTVRNTLTIKGTGATSVTSDANGVITINSTDANTTYSNMTAATASVAGTAGLVPAPAAGKQTAFLRGDGTWVVPTDTNTHYTSHMYVGSGTAANAATTNGNTKIALADDSTVRNTLTIKGTGSTSVTSDANGVITINSTDNNTTYSAFTGATASAAGTTGLVTAPAKGQQGYVLHGDGTWSADKDTTYSAMSANELTTGTATTSRAVTAKVVSDYVKSKTDDKITGLSVNGKVITYTKGDGSTGTITTQDTNTTYSAMGADELSTGTATSARTMTAKVVSDYVKGKTNDKISGLSVSGRTITYTKGDGSTGTITTQDTTYSGFTGATSSAAGTAGLVTAPAKGQQGYVLHGDGTWKADADTKYDAMSATEISTGTATTARSVTAKVLNDYVKSKTDDKITGLSVNGKVITYTKGDGTTGTITTQDTNTTYSAMSADELTTGTATAGRIMTAKVVNDYVKSKTDDKLTGLTVSGKTITYTKGDGSTGTITTQDTTYGAGTTVLLNTGTDTTNKVWTSKALADYVKGESRITADGTFAKKANTAAANITALDTATKNAIKGLSVSGKTITYTKGDGTTGTITTQDTTYGSFTGATASAAGTIGLVTAPAKGQQGYVLHGDGTWSADKDTTYTAMTASEVTTGTGTTARSITPKVLNDFVKTKTDDKITGLTVSGKTITFTKGDGSTGTITTQDTTYSGGTASVLSTGTETTNKLWSSKVLSDFVKGKVDTEANTRSTADTALDNRIGTLSSNGNYIKKSATNNMAANLTLLDYHLKATNDNITGYSADITRNKNNIATLNTSVSSALSSVGAASSVIDLLSNTKADASLANLNASGKRVIANAAMNAVQEYMASQNGAITPSAPMMYNNSSSNGLTVNDAGNGSLHVGEGSYVNGTSSIAIGVGNQVNANNAGAFGDPSIINADASYVLGNDDTVNTGAVGSFVVGNDSVSSAKGGLTFGSNNNLSDTAENSIALGNNINITGKNSVALGSNSIVAEDNVISVGNDNLQRKIINVSAGKISESSNEAIVGSQLYATNQKIQENTDAIAKKADIDGANIDIESWATKLGIGSVEENNTGLINGGSVYSALKEVKDNILIQQNGEVITVGNTVGGSTIDVSNYSGEGRIIAGVVTDPDNPYSAANVGYVDTVSNNIVNAVNESFAQMDNKVNKLGANASALAALTPASFDGDEKWSLAASVGHYHGETGGAVGAFYRPKENVMMNVRMAGGNGENMVAAGVAVSLNKGDIPGVTKRQLANTVNMQAEAIYKLQENQQALIKDREQDKQMIAEQAEQIAELKSMVQSMAKQININK